MNLLTGEIEAFRSIHYKISAPTFFRVGHLFGEQAAPGGCRSWDLHRCLIALVPPLPFLLPFLKLLQGVFESFDQIPNFRLVAVRRGSDERGCNYVCFSILH
jgi:hypothetical protein